MSYAFVLAGQSNMLRNQDNIDAALKSSYGPDIVAVKTARGGSSITKWQRGKIFYQDALTKVLQTKNNGHDIKAILFYQGERDSKNGIVAAKWEKLFRQFVYDFGQDIGFPGIPVVFAQLGNQPTPTTDWPYWEKIRAEQASVLGIETTWRMVKTLGLAFAPNDAPHYTQSKYMVIANRFVSNTKIIVPTS